MKKLQFRALAIFGLALLMGCSDSKKPPGDRPLPIEVATTIQRSEPVFLEEIGNVRSLQTVQVRPQVGGRITKVHVSQGQMVTKGQLLYTIDPRPFKALVDQAEATLTKDQAGLELAENTVKRFEGLVKQDYVAQLTFDKYKTDVEVAKAQVVIDKALLDIARLNLGYTSIRSPLEGRISQYNIDVGNVVVANDSAALTQILRVTPADIQFSITQREFVDVRHAQQEGSFKFEAYLPEFPDKPREGEIYFFDNHIDTDTGTILVKGTVPNEDIFFWPGEFVKIRLQLKVVDNAILVPIASVQIGQEGKFVYIFKPESKTVDYRAVETGQTYGNDIMVTKGLEAGEQVVTNGQINLRPGAKVFLVDKQKTDKKSAADNHGQP